MEIGGGLNSKDLELKLEFDDTNLMDKSDQRGCMQPT
jgi:hypothetical protein